MKMLPKLVVVTPEDFTEARSKQGLGTRSGISAESAGAKGLSMHMAAIPPGGRALPHVHQNHESAIYHLKGGVRVWYGHGLKESVEVPEGAFVYVPPGVPHMPVNTSDTEPCIIIVARTDPNEQESVVLLPEDYGRGEEEHGHCHSLVHPTV